MTKAIYGLTGLLKIKPGVDMSEAPIPFWEPTHNVFYFSDYELTPTLGEIAGYADFDGSFRHQYPVVPRTVTPHKLLDLLSINWQVKNENLAESFCRYHLLYSWYGDPYRFEAIDTGLSHQGKKNKWEACRGLSFVVAFLDALICPRSDGHIELGLAGMADFLFK